MKTAIGKFLVDLFEGAVAGAVAVLSVTNLDTANAKVLAVALLVGALNGVVAAARRAALATRAPAQ